MSAEKINQSTNVVHLDDYLSAPESKPAPRGKPLRRSEALLRECVKRSADALTTALSALMDKVDDALFDLAEKAESGSVRTLYFEAMREVRLQRNAIEGAFKENLLAPPKAPAQSKVRKNKPSEFLAFDESSLDLVDDDDLEESLAITNMVSKIKSQCKKELFALDKRVGLLLGDPQLERSANPIGPEAVCEAFRKACQAIEAPLEVKLIVLKLFDKHMLGELQPVYQEINRYLLEQGVLPQVRTGIKKARNEDRSSKDTPAAPAGGAGSSSETSPDEITAEGLYSALRQLMSVGAEGESRPRPAPAVLQALTGLQREAPAQPSEDPQDGAGMVNILHSLKGSEAVKGMSPLDGQLVDIVAMMFDFIFDDRNLPDRMKALIGRLQIPFVKVAMVDPQFFARRFHPARKLLNGLAEAAIGWQEKHDDDGALFRQAEKIVHRVLDEFTDDVQIFTELLQELEQFLQSEEQRAEAAAEEESEVIESREQLRAGRGIAEEQIRERLDEQAMPEFMRGFFESYWKELLLLIYYQQGSDGGDWEWALKTMDDLVWSVTPKVSSEERTKLLAMLPDLIKRLNKAMGMASVPAVERDKLTSELARYHAAAVRSGGAAAAPDEDEALDAEAGADSPAVVLPSQLLQNAIAKANSAIGLAAERRPECSGMGTTLVAATFHDNRVTIAHVGDSRLYRLREGVMEQLTVDHSLAQQLIERGFYTPEEAKREVRKNVVTRALDGGKEGVPDVQEQAVRPADLYLLCSDGLTDLIDDGDIEAALKEGRADMDATATRLIELANHAGGNDNISVLLVEARAPFPAGAEGEDKDLGDALAVLSRTDVGKKRSHNEDATGGDAHAGVVVLADGMGGCNAGEVASAIAVHTVLKELGAPEAASAAVRQAGVDDSVTQEVTSEAIAVAGLEAEPEGPIYDEYHDLAADLSIGTWVEFHRDQERPVRARLSWVSPAGTLLFTDRTGAKVVETMPLGLAAELRRKTAEILDDAPLVERALSEVTERLKPQAW